MRFHPTPKVAIWLLYLSALITLPTPYLIAVVGGLLPPAALVVLLTHGLPFALRACSRERYVMIVLVGGHLVVLVALAYLGAASVSRLLLWAFTRKLAGLLLAGM